MRKSIIFLSLALLGGCGSINDKIADNTPWSKANVNRPNTFLPLTGLVLSTPPVNNWLFGPCKDEFMMPDGRREQCDFRAKVRGETTPWGRTAANGDAMAYQPGELQCQRTLGFKTECVVVSGAPRPVYLNASPLMGAN